MARRFTIPGLSDESADRIETLLGDRLLALVDLQLTLKHIHWNVVGPAFIGVHEMLDEHVGAVREMTDQVAERIATLGGSPIGTPGHVAGGRSWDDYSIGRARTQEHMAALDVVLTGVISDHRSAMDQLEELDHVTQDMLTGQLAKLELFQWFVRAHLEDDEGRLSHGDARSETQAAERA